MARSSSRRVWLIVLLGPIGIILTLAVGLWGYAYWANSLPPYRPQLPPMPVPNGYEQAASLARQLTKPVQAPRWPAGTVSELRQAVIPARPVLERVRGAFQLEWRAPPMLSYNQQFPEMSAMRECARYFIASAQVARAEGNVDAAMQLSLDAVELGSRFPQGGTVLHALVAVALHSIGFSRVENLVPELSPAGIDRALKRVRRIRSKTPTYGEILEGERVASLAMLSETYGSSGWNKPLDSFRATWEQFQVPGDNDWSMTGEVLKVWLTNKRRAFSDLDRYFAQSIAEQKKPYRHRQSIPLPNDPVSQLGGGAFESAEAHWRRVEAELALLEVALAVERHRRQQGRYPIDLTKVSRQWLPQVPQDPWGQPLQYRLVEGKSTVYSVGPDGKDDGGSATDPQQIVAGSAGDLVFGTLYDERWRAGQPR